MFAFEDNNLTNLQLSSGLSKLDFSSFSRNDLTEVTIPNSVTYIDEFAFYNNKLRNVTLPDSVTYIGALAFGENQLTGISLPNSVETIGVGAFMDNKLTNIVIPEKVTIIESSAFERNKLTSVTMPEGITEIKELAFTRNNLTSIQLPSSVTHIGEKAFQRNKLTNLTLPNSVISMGDWAFSDNQLTSVHIPDGIITIKDYTFFNNKLTEITLPESVTQIGEFAFDGSNLTNLVIPKNVISISQGAFLSNKLVKVVFEGTIDTIGVMAFGQQKLSSPKFKGWFTDYSLTEHWNETVPQAMTIYAVAPTAYTVLFETNGGSTVEPKAVVHGEGIIAPTAPTRADYVFAGWYKDSALQTQWNFALDRVTENITLYAKWLTSSQPQPSVPDTTPTSNPPAPSTSNQITVNVVDANQPDSVLVQTVISRDSSSGVIKDTVNFTTANARESIEKLALQANKKSRIIIPDEQQQVSETTVSIAKEAAQLLSEGQTGLGIDMETVKLDIPSASLANFNADFYFRVVPIKSLEKQQQLEARAKTEQAVQQLAGSATVTLLGQPMTIETNMQNRPVTLTLPLPKTITQEQLDHLAVYIEHSDGTKEVVRGQIVDFKESTKGIQFEVTKFSTFSILYTSVEEEEPEIEEEVVVKKPTSEPYIQGYPDGTFRPSASVTRAQMASMLARNLSNNNVPNTKVVSYSDTAQSWAKNEIEYIHTQGMMRGYSDHLFGPNDVITRAQMAVIAVRWIDKQCEVLSKEYPYCEINKHRITYQDVAPQYWAAEEIERISQMGIMTGMGEAQFAPDRPLTRAQAVKVLNRLFNHPVEGQSEEFSLFTDITNKHWAFYEIQAAAIKE
ncbi:leucine-rich repeat protein [Lysinibacillus macroides]|nr:leucine-rich repeat protein [Lysinibacillus macroides]